MSTRENQHAMNTAAFERDSLRDENTRLRGELAIARTNGETVANQQREMRKLESEIGRLRALVQLQDIEIARLRGENAELVRQSGLMAELKAARAER